MTPEQIAGIASIVDIIAKVNGWGIGTLIFMLVVLPWICLIVITYFQRRQAERRFEEAVQMYENNVTLVEKNEELTTAYKKHLEEFKDIVSLNTQVFTRLTEAIEKNQFCPYNRIQKAASGPQIGG
ncbi:MAG TPA: hypothetical protein PKM59_07255 [Thermodesulfobacteriota bacterium]|nr:hypothetical protein [Thermodesulfobacteriota bacterium]HNU70379.1 hypothetical protein [Thermodesulfobacteriota bacterium]